MLATTLPRMTRCPICGATRRLVFSQTVLSKYLVKYFLCDSCGLLQTEEPFWLDEAYSAPIATTDTGILNRNLSASERIAPVLYRIDPRASYLDVGGGYGLFVRRMRDIGFDFQWEDPFSPNLLARGFERPGGMIFRAVTAIEVAEHLSDPLTWMRDTIRDSGVTTLIFTTLLFEGLPDTGWWYLSPETGQHVSFYQRRTLHALGLKLGLRSLSHGTFHAFTDHHMSERRFGILVSRAGPVVWAFQRRRMTSLTSTDHDAVTRMLRADAPLDTTKASIEPLR